MIFIDHQELSGGKFSLLVLKGKLDSETAGDFESFVVQLLENGKRFILIDVEELEYCSSTGIGLLLYLQKKIVAADGMLALAGASEELSTLFTILGLDRLISLTENRKEAQMLLEKQMQFKQSGERRKESGVTESKPQPLEEFEILEEESTSVDNTPVPLRAQQPVSEESVNGIGINSVNGFKVPLVVECAECGTFTRVQQSGTYLCPECHTEFTVDKDQTIIF